MDAIRGNILRKNSYFMMRNGFGNIIQRLLDHLANRGVHLHLNRKVHRIVRSRAVVMVDGESFDLLVMAVPIEKNGPSDTLLDWRREERECFDNLQVGFKMTTTVMSFSSPNGTVDPTPIVNFEKAMHASHVHNSTGYRHSAQVQQIEDAKDLRCVALQLGHVYDYNKARVRKTLVQFYSKLGYTNIKTFEHWGEDFHYFPHFDNKGVFNGMPWRRCALQGKRHTFFTGASAVFDSYPTIMDHNVRFLDSPAGNKWLKR
jgi:hypothetical protein